VHIRRESLEVSVSLRNHYGDETFVPVSAALGDGPVGTTVSGTLNPYEQRKDTYCYRSLVAIGSVSIFKS
jgi:hypothetical protein